MTTDVLDLFNCLVVNEDQIRGAPCLTLVGRGVVTDFDPNMQQAAVLTTQLKPLSITTLFTREERETASLDYLLTKQLLHYIEVYGLNAPGLFDLECKQGQIVTMHFVKGITVSELESKVQDLLYTNAPVKDAELVKRIIQEYRLNYDINKVANNELRVLLYRPGVDVFTSGDDAVRHLCWSATGEALLIKSPEVIAAVSRCEGLTPNFFERHTRPLAQVFNRHKRLILAAKNKNTATAINRISRLSKTAHVPLKEPVAKVYVGRALGGRFFHETYATDALKHCTVRDKFKFLNLLAQKRVQSATASFKIRNGKVHTRTDRKVYPLDRIATVERVVLMSLYGDLAHLKDQTILLDGRVHYGLPVSRKQTIGQLPFGTVVQSDGNEITSGMYWENAWGASDLDLSTIDMDGNRVGWGGRWAYDKQSSITFSGDLTDARKGAMEFMTSRDKDYGLFVNIFSGDIGSEMELVVGQVSETNKQWIDTPIIRERLKLASRGMVIGFVRGKVFVVYAGRLSNQRISGDNPIVNESKVNPWTLPRLFRVLGIKFDVDRQDDMEYNYDLTYEGFSFDKLEKITKAA